MSRMAGLAARIGVGDEAATPAADLRRAWRGSGPHYEVWFGMVDVAPGVGLWLRYTLLDGRSREAAVWGVLFDAAGLAAAKVAAPLARLDAPDPLFATAAGRLSPEAAEGRVGDLSWRLAFGTPRQSFRLVPPALHRFGLTRTGYSTPYADVRVEGVVRRGDREWRLDGARAMLGHIRGTGYATQRWAWAHCNAFPTAPDAVFEGLSAEPRFRGRGLPAVSCFLLHLDDHTWRFNTPAAILRARSRIDETRWTFSARAGGARLEGEARLPLEPQVALALYTDTDGGAIWCRNSRLATLHLHLSDPARGVHRDLNADGAAAFELGDRRPAARRPDLG